MTLTATAWKLRAQARQALADGDLSRSRDLAARSQQICRTPAAANLHALTDWLATAV
jgi:hypothetical protein